MKFSEQELVERMKLIVKEIKTLPTDAKKINLGDAPSMREVPYWSGLLDQIEERWGSLTSFYQKSFPADFISSHLAEFPSPDQDETTTQMLERKRLLIRDRAGAGKTAPVIKAKHALEQLVVESGRVNPVVVCPNFVLSSWLAKLNEYSIERPRVLSITSANREEAIEEFRKGIKDESLDWTLVSYDALFRQTEGTRDSVADFIMDAARRVNGESVGDNMQLVDFLLGPLESSPHRFMLALDESHTARNPAALRSQAVRKLALAADRFYALTGNPFPDYLDDIGELASLMEPERFPTAEDFNRAYREDPRLIRLFLRRVSKEPVIGVEDIEGMPKIRINPPIFALMSEDEARVYNSILAHRDFGPGSKMALLRLAATDASLLHPENYQQGALQSRLVDFFKTSSGLMDAVRRISSSKYQVLDKLVGEIKARGEKAVIWSKFREGITRNLAERYASIGACFIDGTVSSEPGSRRFSDRDIQRLTFQTNPDILFLIATIDSLREGQDLHAANNAIYVQRDFSPGPNDQATGRVARRGQQKDVNVESIIMSGTIERGIFEREEKKREGILEADRGGELTEEQKEVLGKAKPIIKQTMIKEALQSPRQRVSLMSGHMTNRGAELNRKYLEIGDNALEYARAYNFDWLTSYSAHTARLIAGLIKEIEEKEGSLERIIDLGSGPATVSRILQRPSFCVDLNPFQLNIGRKECERLGVEIQTKAGNVENLADIPNEGFDLGVLSLVLHYGNDDSGGRKRTVLEANRVVRDGGYVIVTLPKNIVQGEGKVLLEEGLYNLGLEPVKSRAGHVVALDSVSNQYEVYAALCRKIHSNPPNFWADRKYIENFVLNPEFRYSKGKGSEGCAPRNGNGSSSEICSVFKFEDSGEIIGARASSQSRLVSPVDRVITDPEEIVRTLDSFMKGGKK